MKKYLLGMDIGGTKIECAIMEITNEIRDPDSACFGVPADYLSNDSGRKVYGHILSRARVPTDRKNSDYRDILGKIEGLCHQVCKSVDVEFSNVQGVGIGLPGTVDPERKVMLNGNTALFIEKDITKDLNQIFPNEVRIVLDNDASCFALAEVVCGAGQTHFKKTGRDVLNQIGLGIILGTGCGGGIVINGKVLHGRNGAGGELGHTELITNGHPCYCGKRGCAEQYLSGPGVEAAFASRMYSQIPELPDAKKIFDMALEQEPFAVAIVKQYKGYLGKFLANLTNIFDPDYFVLGGGVSRRKEIYEGLEEVLAENTFADVIRPKVYQHELGDSAGVVGAALLLLE